MPNSLSNLSKFVKPGNSVHAPMGGARVVWLRQRNRMDDKGQNLYRRMQGQGLSLAVADVFDVSSAELLNADLVLLDAFDSVEGSIETVVARIRFESRVPLVMLTDGYSTEQLVTALTPVEVLLVRCNALLRRWLSNKP